MADAQLERQLGIQLPLKGAMAERAGDAFVGLAAAVTQYFLAGFFLALAFKPSLYGGDPTPFWRVVAVALAIAVYALGRWGRRQIGRATRLDARLIVMPDCLIVRHEGLLTAPMTIPRELIEAVTIDDGSERVDFQRLPMLNALPRKANVQLLFTELIDFPARRRWPAPARPLPGRRERGLLVRVKDPAAAKRAFAGWSGDY